MRLRNLFGRIVLVAFIVLPGCHWIATFDTSGLEPPAEVYEVWDCSADVRTAEGEQIPVSSDEEPYSGRSFFTHSSCGRTDGEAVLADWTRWVTQQIEDTWCVEPGTAVCDSVAPIEETPCPPELAVEARFCEARTDPCLGIEPEIVDFEILLAEAGLDDQRVAVGFPAPFDAEVVVSNTCDAEVSVQLDGTLTGRDAADFEIVDNGCDIPDPEHPELYPDGRWLAMAGLDGDRCSLSVRFTPSRHGRRFARKDFSQDSTFPYLLPLRGHGLSGRWDSTPDEICVDDVLGDGCTAEFPVPLANQGPGLISVTEIVASGRFEVTSALPTPLEPDETHVALVLWCQGAGGDVDDDGTLTIDSNARVEQLLIPILRRTGGC